jgi:hypothetical protein
VNRNSGLSLLHLPRVPTPCLASSARMDQSIAISTAALTQPPPGIKDFPLMQQAQQSLDSLPSKGTVGHGEDAKLQVGESQSPLGGVREKGARGSMTATFVTPLLTHSHSAA